MYRSVPRARAVHHHRLGLPFYAGVSSIGSGIACSTLCRMADAYKVRENRLRRMAARQGLRYRVSRRRDRRAADYGRVWLTDARTGAVVAEFMPADLLQPSLHDQVEAFLTRD